MRFNAFLLGSNTMGLQYCETDMQSLSAILSKYGYNIIKPEPNRVSIEVDLAMLDGLRNLDTLLVYISGHAVVEQQKLYLMIKDDNGNPKYDISNLIDRVSRCNASKKIIMLDCCNSGYGIEGWNPKVSDKYLILTASDRIDTTKEIDELESSFLAYSIMKCFRRLIPEVFTTDGMHIRRLNDWLYKEAISFNSKSLIQVTVPSVIGSFKSEFSLVDMSKNYVAIDRNSNPFLDKVLELFNICGYNIEELDSSLQGIYDAKVKLRQGLDRRDVFIKCSEKAPQEEEVDKIISVRDRQFSSVFYVCRDKFPVDIITKCTLNGIEYRTYDTLVTQMINFTPYVERVLNDPGFTKLSQEYEEPYIQTTQGRKPAWTFLSTWLNKSESNWLTVLGDYGIGKTSLLRMALFRLMSEFKSDPENKPIPIFVPLQNFVKSFTFRNLMLALFEDIGLSGVYYDAFESLIKRGKVILLLDSFDEMAQKLNREEINNNLRELLSGISGKSKSILTSRPTYFENEAERLRIFADVNLLPEDHEDYTIYYKFSEQDKYLKDRIKLTTTIQLQDLTEEQRKRFIRNVLKDNTQALEKVEFVINKIQGLKSLSERPVIARLLTAAIPALRDAEIRNLPNTLNEASLFDIIINELLSRDEPLFAGILNNSERHLFLKELAYLISLQNQNNYIDNQKIRELIRKIFAHKIMSSETPDIVLEQMFRICRRAAGLSVENTSAGFSGDIENLNSRIGFSHNILREYLYAEFIKENLFKERATILFRNSSISDGTIMFLRNMFSREELDDLVSRIRSIHSLREFYFKIAWHVLPNETREDIAYIVGDPPNLSELDVCNIDFSSRELSEADFSNSLIGGTNFTATILNRSIFNGSLIISAAFEDASLSDVDFSQSAVHSIVVYDDTQNDSITLHDDNARQWLYTQGSNVGDNNNINRLTRSNKYRIIYRILKKMDRYGFNRSMNELGLLRGLGQHDEITGRSFLSLLHRRGYIKVVRQAARGGRGADVVTIVSKSHKQSLQDLFEGRCPEELKEFFDDL